MKKEKEQIDILNAKTSTLPLGYQHIYLKKIPPFHIENKLMLHNKKFKATTYQVMQSDKPISKIVK